MQQRLIHLLGMNLVSTLVGSGTSLEKIVYVLVGVAGVYELYGWASKMK